MKKKYQKLFALYLWIRSLLVQEILISIIISYFLNKI